MNTGYYANQYFVTSLAVIGGINASQTTGIILQNTTGIGDLTKPGIALLSYTDPLNENSAEWVTFTSINQVTNELIGVTRGAERGSGKTHVNGATVAFPISKSHINNLVDALSVEGDANNLIATTLNEGDFASNSNTALATQQSIKTYVDNTNYATNRLINGNFDVWQENTTFTTPNDNTYTADQWVALTSTNGSWTYTRSTDAPVGSTYSIKATNVTANKQMALMQPLEFLEASKLKGKTVSVSFYAKTTSSKEIGKLRCSLLSWAGTADSITRDVVGTWAGNGTDPTWAANWTAEVAGVDKTLTTSWQQFKVEGIEIDSATVNNLALVIWVDDTTITSGDEVFVSQATLVASPVLVPVYVRTINEETILCMRYYEKINGSNYTSSGSTDINGGVRYIYPLKVRKRAQPPSVSLTGTWARNGAAGGPSAASVDVATPDYVGGFLLTGVGWVVANYSITAGYADARL